ncbi:hypothetical protein NDU88_003619 [Pleurodeles waltl]|uniref:Uncharacterized protein n=1 Tax=Pleurodeles waltl TaxID=8319 RepID=A0AAV7UEK8_PLEWA|nr:hypothetical protein NDU88_003619 [Pleurodeles waltl]
MACPSAAQPYNGGDHLLLQLNSFEHPTAVEGPRPWPRVAPLHHPSECVFRWATRTQTASPPQLVVSAGNLRFLQPPGRLNLQPCPWPRPRSRACPLCSSGVARIQCLSLRAPPQCAISPGPPQVPASTSAAAVEPAWCLPLFCAVRALTTSIRGTTQGRGLCRVPRPTDSEVPDGQIRHPQGRRRGPHTLGPLLWSTQGLRAASTYGPAQGCDLDPVPAPCVIPGPPASSGTVSVRFSCARSHLGPLAPASTSAAAGEPARRFPLFCAVRALTTSALGTTQGRGICHVLRPADSEVPDRQIRHPRAHRRGPHTLGPLLWSRPAAWTSLGPGKARF